MGSVAVVGGRSRRPGVLDAATTALIPLRPLTIGEILDGAFLVVRRNARMMVGLPLVIAGATAVYLLIGVGLWLLLGNTRVEWAQVAVAILMGLIGLFGLVQCLVWMTAILSRVSLQTVLGDGFAPASSVVNLRTSLPMFWPMLGLSLAQYLVSNVIQGVVGTIAYLLLIPAMLLGAGAGIAGSIVSSLLILFVMALSYGYISLTVPALAVEGRRAPGWIGKPLKPTTVISSFERSIKLVGLRGAPRIALIFAGMIIVCGIVIGVVSIGVALVIFLFASSLNLDAYSLISSPWTIFGVTAFATLVAMSALLAYVAAVQTMIYLDLRMRREALDLALRFDCVPIPQTSPPPMVRYPYPPPPPMPGPPNGSRP